MSKYRIRTQEERDIFFRLIIFAKLDICTVSKYININKAGEL